MVHFGAPASGPAGGRLENRRAGGGAEQDEKGAHGQGFAVRAESR
jgi:hypothetical protein